MKLSAWISSSLTARCFTDSVQKPGSGRGVKKGNCSFLPCAVGQMCFPKQWARSPSLEFGFRPDFSL